MRVLVAEDDDSVAGALIDVLRSRAHQPVWVRTGAEVLRMHRKAEIVLLDLGLPDSDGLDVLRMLRQVSDMPVLVLTARGDERCVVRGLRLGADDYLVKPVRLAELLARIEAVARRRPHPGASSSVIEIHGVVVDLDAHTVRADGVEIPLTNKEFQLLAVLARRAGAAVSRELIMDEVWGAAFVGASRSLDVHLTQLRAKLSRPGLITTIRGYGYRLEV